MFLGRFAAIICLPVVGFALVATDLWAGERKDFFEANKAREQFTAEVRESTDPRIEFFLPVPKPDPEEQELEQPVLRAVVQTSDPKAQKPLELPPGKYSDKEVSIVTAFGDPSAEFPITPVESAPTPFKGMIEAQKAGEYQLAFQYARQYVRYKRALQDNARLVTGMLGKAMVREGLLPERSWANTEDYEDLQPLLDKDLKDAAAAKQLEQDKFALEPEDLGQYDEQTQELLRRASIAEDNEASGKSVAQPSSPEEERALRSKIHVELARTLPRDPKGLVDAYFFVRLSDQHAIKALPAIEQLYRKWGGDKKVNIIVLTPDLIPAHVISQFRQRYNLSVPIKSGGTLAKKLKVERTPEAVLVAPSSGSMVRLEEISEFIKLDEMIAVVRGEGK